MIHLRLVFSMIYIYISIENDTRGKKNYRSFVTVEKEELEKFCNSV